MYLQPCRGGERKGRPAGMPGGRLWRKEGKAGERRQGCGRGRRERKVVVKGSKKGRHRKEGRGEEGRRDASAAAARERDEGREGSVWRKEAKRRLSEERGKKERNEGRRQERRKTGKEERGKGGGEEGRQGDKREGREGWTRGAEAEVNNKD